MSKEHLDMLNKRGLPHLCAHVVNPASSDKERRDGVQLAASCLVTDKLMEPRRNLSMMLSAELRRIVQVIRTVLNKNRKELVCNILLAYGISSCIIHNQFQ